MVTPNIRHFPTFPMKCNNRIKTRKYDSAMTQKLRVAKHFKRERSSTLQCQNLEREEVTLWLKKHSWIVKLEGARYL